MGKLWFKIAKNEIRLWTSQFRRHRLLFFSIIILFMGIYAFLLVPLALNAVNPFIQAFALDLGDTGLGYFMFYILSILITFIFIFCITYPMSTMLQSTDLSGQLEILLKTPIKAQDILFGKFIGRMPIYLIILFAFAPWLIQFFNIALTAFNITTPVFAQILIYSVLFIIIVLGMWLGTLLSAFIESKVRKSERSRDLGRAMMVIIPILTVTFVYGLIYVILNGLDPTSPLYIILQGFPSTWGVFIIIFIYGYPNIAPINVSIFIILLIGLTIAVLYLGYHVAGRFYSLEPISTENKRITSEKRFYHFIRKLMPGDFGVQVLSQLKQFSRKLENFSRIIYAIALSAMMITFNSIFAKAGSKNIELTVMLGSFIYSLLIALMLGCWVIIGSKDNLWIYKKAPNGVKKFVKSVYITNVIYTLPLGVIYGILLAIFQGLTLFEGFLLVLFSITFLLSLMASAIGIAFIFPTFEERGSKMGILMMSFMGVSVGIFIASSIIALIDWFGIGTSLTDIFGSFAWPLLTLLLTSIVGYALLKLGIKKLSALE